MQPERSAPDASADPLPPSAWALVACNLVPLAGAALWGWRVADVVMLYWLENVVVGAMYVLRIAAATPAEKPPASMMQALFQDQLKRGKWILIGFFAAFYGSVCWGQYDFLAAIFPVRDAMLLEPAVAGALLCMVAGHLYSYFHDYIGRAENRGANVGLLLFRPHVRLVVIHIFMITGGVAVHFFDNPVALMLVFVICKAGIEFAMQRNERAFLAKLRLSFRRRRKLSE